MASSSSSSGFSVSTESFDSPFEKITIPEPSKRSTNKKRLKPSPLGQPAPSSSSLYNVDEPARLTTEFILGEPVPKFQRTADVDSGVFDSKRLEGIIDRLEIGNMDHSYKMLAEVLKSFRPQYAKLFDAFHNFTTIVEGGCGVNTPFWKKDAMKGHQHLAKLAYEAMVQPQYKFPLTELPTTPFTVHDLEYILAAQERLNVTGRPAIMEVLFILNRNTQQFRVELIDPLDSQWMESKGDIPHLAQTLWNKLNVRHLKHPFTLAPTRLSVESWLESIRLDRERGEIATILSKPELSDLEAIETTLLSIMDPKFWAAFMNAMNIAKDKIPDINILHPRFLELLKNTYFVNLVVAYYRYNRVNNNATFSNRSSRPEAAYAVSAAIDLFLKGPAAFKPSVKPPSTTAPITSSTELLQFAPSSSSKTRTLLRSSIF